MTIVRCYKVTEVSTHQVYHSKLIIPKQDLNTQRKIDRVPRQVLPSCEISTEIPQLDKLKFKLLVNI